MTNPLATLLRAAAHRIALEDAADGRHGRHLPSLLAHIADDVERYDGYEVDGKVGDYIGLNHVWTAAVAYARDVTAKETTR